MEVQRWLVKVSNLTVKILQWLFQGSTSHSTNVMNPWRACVMRVTVVVLCVCVSVFVSIPLFCLLVLLGVQSALWYVYVGLLFVWVYSLISKSV